MLEADYSRAVYVGWHFHRISQTECRPFSECIRREHPEVIVNNRRLKEYYVALDDGGYMSFLERPEALGYERMSVPEQDAEVFVREDVLSGSR